MPHTLPKPRLPKSSDQTFALLDAMYDDNQGKLRPAQRVEIAVITPQLLRWTIGTAEQPEAYSGLASSSSLDLCLEAVRLILSGSTRP